MITISCLNVDDNYVLQKDLSLYSHFHYCCYFCSPDICHITINVVNYITKTFLFFMMFY